MCGVLEVSAHASHEVLAQLGLPQIRTIAQLVLQVMRCSQPAMDHTHTDITSTRQTVSMGVSVQLTLWCANLQLGPQRHLPCSQKRQYLVLYKIFGFLIDALSPPSLPSPPATATAPLTP